MYSVLISLIRPKLFYNTPLIAINPPIECQETLAV